MPYVSLRRKPDTNLPASMVDIKYLHKDKHDYESFFIKELKSEWIERFVLVRLFQWFRVPNHWEEPWEITPHGKPWIIVLDFNVNQRESNMPAVVNHKDKEHPTTVHSKVAEAITNLGPSTEEKIVDTIVDREKVRRANAWVQVWDILTKLQNDLKKIKPQHLHYDDEGKGVGEPHFSKQQADERKKLQDQINKRVNALNKALEKEEWDDVFNLASNKSDSSDKDKGESKEEAK
jgi:hypothetical protein